MLRFIMVSFLLVSFLLWSMIDKDCGLMGVNLFSSFKRTHDRKKFVNQCVTGRKQKAAHSCCSGAASPAVGVEVLSRGDDDIHPLRVQKSVVSSCFTGRRLVLAGAK